MLQRVISIKNIGRFRNCAAVGDVTFRRFTLIFSENGRGKATLCAILRSLSTNMPSLIGRMADSDRLPTAPSHRAQKLTQSEIAALSASRLPATP